MTDTTPHDLDAIDAEARSLIENPEGSGMTVPILAGALVDIVARFREAEKENVEMRRIVDRQADEHIERLGGSDHITAVQWKLRAAERVRVQALSDRDKAPAALDEAEKQRDHWIEENNRLWTSVTAWGERAMKNGYSGLGLGFERAIDDALRAQAEAKTKATERDAHPMRITYNGLRNGKTRAVIEAILSAANERGIEVTVIYPQDDAADRARADALACLVEHAEGRFVDGRFGLATLEAIRALVDAALATPTSRPDQAWEQAVTGGQRKAFDDFGLPPRDPITGEPQAGWELHYSRGRPGEACDCFDYTEERYWKRWAGEGRKPAEDPESYFVTDVHLDGSGVRVGDRLTIEQARVSRALSVWQPRTTSTPKPEEATTDV